jgi:signal transduction histidine kinase
MGSESSFTADGYPDRSASELLIEAVQRLSLSRDMPGIVEVVRHAARAIAGSDGASVILREGDRCHYVDEDAIGPLWKGRLFPMQDCISGWCMLHKQAVAIPDIYADTRIPVDAYRPTFVKSLLMVPIRSVAPIGAIGSYWADHREPSPEEIRLLCALADSTAVAINNVQISQELERRVQHRTTQLARNNEQLAAEIVERQRNDEEREQLLLQAQQDSRARDEILRIVSHDLRNPLSSIMMGTELGLRELNAGDAAAVRRGLDIVRRATGQMQRLIDDLVDVASIDAHRLAIRLAHCSLPELLESAVSSFQGMAKRQSLQLLGNWDATLPPVECDHDRVLQVLGNLLANAIKITPAGGRVEVRAYEQNDFLRVEVSDTGPGIAPEELPHLFSRYWRGDNAPYRGTGLGLAIARGIVATHGGRIWAESRVGEGSVFKFTLRKAPSLNS